MRRPTQSPPTSRRRAFTLVELMVVIGIIVLLVAIVLGVASALVGQSETRETRNTLSLLEAAVEEFERAQGRRLTYGLNGTPPQSTYDFLESAADDLLIIQLLNRIRGNEAVETILARIDGEFLRIVPSSPQVPGGGQEVIDAWGNRIRVVFPGRDWRPQGTPGGFDPPDRRDADGTFQTNQERRLGIARNRSILFVSAGPSGRIGDLSGNQDQRDQAADNIYSYEPILP